MGKRTARVFLGVCVALLGVSVAWLAAGGAQADFGRWIPGRCTVGVSGAAVSVTADGLGAESECRDLLALGNPQPDQGLPALVYLPASGYWYEYTGAEPGGAVICQAHWDNATLTVRDAGAMTEYGNEVCHVLLPSP